MDQDRTLFEQAMEAAKRKDNASARRLLGQLLKQEPQNIDAWLLASYVMETRQKAIRCLERALQIDPGNARAIQRLAKLQGRSTEPTPAAGPASALEPAPSPVSLSDTSRAESFVPQPQGLQQVQPKPRTRNGLLVFAGVFVAVCCLGMAGIAAFSPDSPFRTASAPTPTANELFSVLYQNSTAANSENLAGYMATIHPDSSLYQSTETLLVDVFSQYDLEYYFYNLELTGLKTNEARVHFSLSTRKLRGPAFRDNTVIGTMILKPDNGVWKIYDQEVEDVQY